MIVIKQIVQEKVDHIACTQESQKKRLHMMGSGFFKLKIVNEHLYEIQTNICVCLTL